ncbi:hypothetical protein HK104_000081 [Borealophlyctis nickersoniae]|nr:hypothetical protein HK104_000081 [Borealophlyctis nickersoniae]
MGVSHLSPVLELADQHADVLNDEAVQMVGGSLLEPPRPNLLVIAKGIEAKDIPIPVAYSIAAEDSTSGVRISDFAHDFTELAAAKYPGLLSTLYIKSEKRDAPVPNAAEVKLYEKDAVVSIPGEAPEGLEKTLGELSTSAYQQVHEHFAEKFGSRGAIFDENVTEDKLFMVEVEFVSSLFEALRIQNLHSTSQQTSQLLKFMVINLSKLHLVAEKYGLTSKQYKSAVSIGREVLDQVVSTFQEIHKNKASVEIISVSPSVPATGGTWPRALVRRAVTASAATQCPSDVNTCNTVFANCSFHGTCTAQKVPRLNNSMCYLCSCNNKWTDDQGKPVKGFSGPVTWTGDACQYQDISVSFQILFWLTVVLIVTLVLAVGLLYDVGESDAGSIGGSSTGRTKSD